MATSWATETKEKVNYTKLYRLLCYGGTLALRTVFDGICPPASLGATLTTNRSKLQKLKKPARKVLNQNQWDLLYSPSGASPKSEDFDITLLFILLRNICRLSRPATGWDALPPLTDTSLEANLVRIKFYRNDVTAHSSKAEVDDTLFEHYWSAISDALLSLGLKQVDIDELKSSSLGADTEIQRKLKAIKSDTSEIKTGTTEIKTDTSKIKTDISEIKTDTSEIKTDTSGIKTHTSEIKTHTSGIKTDTSEIKTDISEIKTDTSEIKTDTSGIKTDTSEIKTHTSEIKTHTSEIKTDTSEIKTDTSEIKTDTSDIKTDVLQIKTDTSDIKTDTSGIKSDTAEMKSELSDIKAKMPSTQSEITKLAYIDFKSLIEKSCGFYHQSTRQWILDQVKDYVEQSTSEAGVVLIRAGAGMGKSVVAAKICDIYQKVGFLGGCHFFQHNNSLRNNPKDMMQSIARQLCNSLTGYQATLEAKLKTLQERKISDLNCEELFGLLFEEPLSQICINHNVVIVIDALDECASQFKEELEDVLNRKLSDLPSRIRFVITTRPLPSCRNLSPVVQIEIDPSDLRNVQDLKEFFSFQLAEQSAEQLIDKLMEISKGFFLVAHFVLELLDEGGNEPITEVLKCFPYGISSVYKYYFTRIQKVIKPYIPISESGDGSFFKMLDAMVAAKSPIPKKMFYEILQLKSVEEVQRRNQMERNEAVHLLHTIFPVENDHVNVFHKTVTDWLNRDGENEHNFSVSASKGREELAQKSLDVLKAFKNTAKEGRIPFDQPLVLSDSESFALRIGLEYINESSKLGQFEKEEIIYDFIIVAAVTSYCDCRYSKWRTLSERFYPHPDFVLMYCYLAGYKPFFPKLRNLFGHCLSIVGDVCSSRNRDVLPTAQKEELLHLRIKYKLPYYTFHPVVSSLPPALQLRPQSSSDDDDEVSQHQTCSSIHDLLVITNGFIAVKVDPDAEPPTSTVLSIKDDGSFAEHKTFVSSHVRGVSPDKKLLIITKTDSSKIEQFDVTTLEKVREYNCPIHCVDSCHIFGDEQWYIVVKAQRDPTIYILDGLNGQLHDTIEVGENDKIEDVSQCGHILISDTLKENVCKLYMNETIYYYPLVKYGFSDEIRNILFKFSDDGKYFVLYKQYSVHLFRTNDGILLARFFNDVTELVFLSFPYLITRIYHSRGSFSCLKVFDLKHRKVLYVAPMKLTKQSKLVVPPQHHTDKSIPRTVFALNNDGLVKYEFHNLEQNL